MKIKYTEEELKIINYIENTNPKSIPNLKKEIVKITKAAKQKLQNENPSLPQQ